MEGLKSFLSGLHPHIWTQLDVSLIFLPFKKVQVFVFSVLLLPSGVEEPFPFSALNQTTTPSLTSLPNPHLRLFLFQVWVPSIFPKFLKEQVQLPLSNPIL